jgi:hypothetical protein
MQGGPSPNSIRPAGQAVQPNMLQPGGLVYAQQPMQQQQQQQQQQQVRMAVPAQGQVAAAAGAMPGVVMPSQFSVPQIMSLLANKALEQTHPQLINQLKQQLQQQQRLAAGIKPEQQQQQVQVQVQQAPVVMKTDQQQQQQQQQPSQQQQQQAALVQQQQQQQRQIMQQMMQQRGTQQPPFPGAALPHSCMPHYLYKSDMLLPHGSRAGPGPGLGTLAHMPHASC